MHSYSPIQSLLLILYFSGNALLELAPYVIGGVIIGEALKLTSWTKLIYGGVSRSPLLATLFASVLGAVSPLCTYGTVPVVLQLFRAGVHIAPLITFLSVSAMMNPQLFILTWGGLGPEMAIVRVLAVMGFGLFLGFSLYRLPASWVVNPAAMDEKEPPSKILNRSAHPFTVKGFSKDVLETLQFVGFYLVLGVILSATIDVIIPKQWLRGFFSGNRFISLLSSALLGVPLYACGGGVIPVVRELMANGMAKGAAMAFMLVGPATRVTPLIALATILRLRFIFIYILAVITFAVLFGFVYQ